MFNDVFDNQPGVYTFVWFWQFTSLTNIYTTCWEANVTADGTVVTITDTGNNNNGESESSEEVQAYQVTIPVCYDGTSYDGDALESAFDELTTKSNNNVQFEILSYMTNSLDDTWNASVATNELELESGLEALVLNWASNGTICDYVMNEFNNVGTCSICGGAKVNSLTKTGSNNGDDDEGTKLAIGLIFVAVLLLSLAAYYFYKTRINPDKPSENVMATSITNGATNTQQNIVRPTSTASDGPKPTRRPPVPPPAPIR